MTCAAWTDALGPLHSEGTSNQEDQVLHTVAAVALGAFFIAVGVSHFLAPGYYRTLVPAWVPAPRAVVAVSGGVEIAIGVAVLLPSARWLGAWAAAGLVTVYLASHIDAARTATVTNPRFLDRPRGVAARLVVNVAYIGWAVVVALGAAP